MKELSQHQWASHRQSDQAPKISEVYHKRTLYSGHSMFFLFFFGGEESDLDPILRKTFGAVQYTACGQLKTSDFHEAFQRFRHDMHDIYKIMYRLIQSNPSSTFGQWCAASSQ